MSSDVAHYRNLLGLEPKSIGKYAFQKILATHLPEYETDITYIQKLLGHNNFETKQGHARVSNLDISRLKSPLNRRVDDGIISP